MSGTITPTPGSTFASTPFSDAEKADIRRFAGYPTYGLGASGFQSWRFFTVYGELEFRLNNFAPAELQNVRLKLVELYALDAAIAAAGALLQVDTAAVFKRNANEIADRSDLFDRRRRQFCAILGVPPGPDLGSGGGLSLIV